MMNTPARPQIQCYAVAVLSTTAVVILRYLLSPWLGPTAYLLPFVLAVMVSAWCGGVKPGLLATALGAGISVTLFAPRTAFADIAAIVRFALFLVVGVCVSLLCEALHVARRKLEKEAGERFEAELSLRENEIRQRRVLEAIPQLVWTTGPDGQVDFLSRQWCEYTGVSEAAHLGNGWLTAVHPDDVEPLMKERRAAYAAGVELDTLFRIRRADGAWRWFQTSAVPLRDTNGVISRWIASSTDIDDQKQAEEALRLSETRFHQLADSMPQIVWAAQPDGRVDYYNDRWYQYTGCGRDVDPDWLACIHPDDRQHLSDSWLRSIESATPFQAEHRLREGQSGDHRWFLARALPVKDGSGRIIRWFGTCTDIDATKRLQDELHRMDRRKNEFLATLAHELRNPLAPVRNAIQVLHMKGPSTPELQWARDMIDRQVHQMTHLIDDLLDVSRITRNKLELRRRRVELSTVVQGAVETSRSMIEEHGHELTVLLPPDPIHVDCDITRLGQVFSNLLQNAAKYTEDGGHIQLRAERHGDEVVVIVKDDGIGISAEHLPAIFDMFSQVDSSVNRSGGGLGIGLTLVKQLVELHRGTIIARSDGPGRGSEFIVSLPIVSATPAQAHPPITGESLAPAAAAPLRILVADDNHDSADSLAMLLQIAGHDVRAAYDGEDALATTAAWVPDVALLDIGMPKLNGYDIARKIREQPWGRTMVLIAVTGWSQAEDKLHCYSAGFDLHMVKPAHPADLTRLLADLRSQREILMDSCGAGRDIDLDTL